MSEYCYNINYRIYNNDICPNFYTKLNDKNELEYFDIWFNKITTQDGMEKLGLTTLQFLNGIPMNLDDFMEPPLIIDGDQAETGTIIGGAKKTIVEKNKEFLDKLQKFEYRGLTISNELNFKSDIIIDTEKIKVGISSLLSSANPIQKLISSINFVFLQRNPFNAKYKSSKRCEEITKKVINKLIGVRFRGIMIDESIKNSNILNLIVKAWIPAGGTKTPALVLYMYNKLPICISENCYRPCTSSADASKFARRQYCSKCYKFNLQLEKKRNELSDSELNKWIKINIPDGIKVSLSKDGVFSFEGGIKITYNYEKFCYNNVNPSYWVDNKNKPYTRQKDKRKITDEIPELYYTDRSTVPKTERPLNYRCELMKPWISYPSDIIEMDHISGSHSDNRIENIVFLCRICHAIKTVLNKDKAGGGDDGLSFMDAFMEHWAEASNYNLKWEEFKTEFNKLPSIIKELKKEAKREDAEVEEAKGEEEEEEDDEGDDGGEEEEDDEGDDGGEPEPEPDDDIALDVVQPQVPVPVKLTKAQKKIKDEYDKLYTLFSNTKNKGELKELLKAKDIKATEANLKPYMTIDEKEAVWKALAYKKYSY